MADYFLHVDLKVPCNDSADFERAAKEFLAKGPPRRPFQRIRADFDYELVLALKATKPMQYYERSDRYSVDRSVATLATNRRLKDGDRVDHYVHLWRINDQRDLDLADVMTACADDPFYIALDSLVLASIQDVVLRVKWLESPQTHDTMTRFLRVKRAFLSKDLGTYLFNFRGMLNVLKEAGWHTLGHYQNTTGPLNVVTEFWQTRDGSHEIESMGNAIKAFKGGLFERFHTSFHGLHTEERREMFALAPYFG